MAIDRTLPDGLPDQYMSDEWTKERDAESDNILETKLMPLFRQSNMSAQAKGVVKETAKIGFDLGADFGRAYELKRSAELVEKLKAIIWAYENNVG